MTTLTLEQLRQTKKVDAVCDKPITCYFTELDAVNSILFEHLLFRFQNHTRPVFIYLLDYSAVSSRDIETGVYLPQDIGRPKSKVLLDRYSGFFSNIRLILGENRRVFQVTSSHDLNTVRFLFTKGDRETTNINLQIQNFLQELNREHFTFIFRHRITEEGAVISSQYLKNGQLYGGEEQLPPNVRQGVNFAQQYTINSLISQRLFNIINELISENGSIRYYELVGDILQGQMNTKYFLGRLWDGFLSQYVYLYNDISVPNTIINEFAHLYDTFYENREYTQRVENTLSQLENTPLKELIRDQLRYVVTSIHRYSQTVDNDEERLKLRFTHAILFKLLNTNTQEIVGTQQEQDYLKSCLLFILFAKENIYRNDIF